MIVKSKVPFLMGRKSGAKKHELHADNPEVRLSLYRLIPSLLVFCYSVWFSYAHASLLPYGDEYELVPVMTGERVFDIEYLFSQHNEHRIPISRGLLHSVLPLFGYDFRFAASAVPVVVGSGLAILLGAIGLTRGEFRWSDNAASLMLLNPGHAENFLWGFQLQYASNLFLLFAFLACITLIDRMPQRTGLLLFFAGLSLLLLPGTGANGWIMSVCLWPALGLTFYRSRGCVRRWGFALTALGIATSMAYYASLASVEGRTESSANFLESMVAFLAIFAGPVSAEHWKLVGSIIAALLTVTLIWLAKNHWRYRDVRSVIAATVVACGLIYAVAAARYRVVHDPTEAFQVRYFLLVITGPVAVWWYASLRSDVAANRITYAAFAIAIGLYAGNWQSGHAYASDYHARRTDLMRDLDSGTPLRLLSERYYGHPFGLYNPSPEVLYQRLESMRREGMGAIAAATISPKCRRLTEDGKTLVYDSQTGLFSVSPMQPLHGICWTWAVDGAASDPRSFLAVWNPGAPDSEPTRFLGVPDRSFRRQSLTVGNVVKQFAFGTLSESTRLAVDDVVVYVVAEEVDQ